MNLPLREQIDYDEIKELKDNPIFLKGFSCGIGQGWNNCLDKIKELNKKIIK